MRKKRKEKNKRERLVQMWRLPNEGVKGGGLNCFSRKAVPVPHNSWEETGPSVFCSARVLPVALFMATSRSGLGLELQFWAVYFRQLSGDFVHHRQTC